MGRKKPVAREFLTPQAVSARWDGRIAVGTLRNWRWLKRGPPFVRIERQVMYRLDDLIAWEKSNTVQSERA